MYRLCVAEDKECGCVYVREREGENRDTRCRDTENAQDLEMYIHKGEKTQLLTRWEEDALYSHPLSSLSTRHINLGNEEAHKLCVIGYDFVTHNKC